MNSNFKLKFKKNLISTLKLHKKMDVSSLKLKFYCAKKFKYWELSFYDKDS